MEAEAIVETASTLAIQTIEEESSAADMSLTQAAALCRQTAKLLSDRAELFESEAAANGETH